MILEDDDKKQKFLVFIRRCVKKWKFYPRSKIADFAGGGADLTPPRVKRAISEPV